MKKVFLIIFSGIVLISLALISFSYKGNSDDRILSFVVNPNKDKLEFYWKNESGENFKSIGNLKNYLKSKNKDLIFAMNGGMYKRDLSPQGLFIQDFKTLSKIDTSDGKGNFYLKPNGVFFISSDNKASICESKKILNYKNINFATQSGPLLILNGVIHSAFNKDSKNLNIRNGVGILPNNEIVFAMSKEEINFYDFAKYFESLGCKNALYLDGYVSRTYLPSKNWVQIDGEFGVIIGVTEKIKN